MSNIIKELIEESTNIADSLNSADDFSIERISSLHALAETLLPKAESALKDFSSQPMQAVSAGDLAELEAAASRVWNAATISSRSIQNDGSPLIAQVKLVSITILRIHDYGNRNSVNGQMRCLKCSLKSFEYCINCKLREAAKKVKGFSDVLILQFSSIETEGYVLEQLNSYKAKWQVLFLSLALSCCEFDEAKIYERNLNSNFSSSLWNPQTLEICKILYNSSVDLFSSNSMANCLVFIRACLNYIEFENATSNEKSDQRYIKLKSSLLLVECLKLENKTENNHTVEITLKMLQKEFDNCLDVYVSTLNYWRDKKTQVVVDIQEIMMTMVKSVPSRDCHEGIVNVLKNLSAFNYKASLICLDYLFANYSSPHETHDKLENLFITRMWITISKRCNLPSSFLLKDVKGYFKLAEKTFAKSISEKTRSWITTMIWKEGSLALKSRFYEEALAWFEIGLSRNLFSIEDLTDPNNDKGKLLKNVFKQFITIGEILRSHI